MLQACVRESVHPAHALFERMRTYEHPVLLNKLQHELNLSAEDARTLFEDVKKFLALSASTPQGLAPTTAVDKGWHQFILFTQAYPAFCKEYCGHMVHHVPEDPFSAVKDYESVPRTRELAELIFGGLSSNWLDKQGPTCQGKDCSPNDCTSCKGAP